jgi:hypothetical protein
MKLTFDPTTGKLKLVFAYQRFLVEAVKDLRDRRYNPEEKTWTVGFQTVGELKAILALLAGQQWPADQLNLVEAEAIGWLSASVPSNDLIASQTAEFEAVVKPDLMKLAELLETLYLAGTINQAEYGRYIRIINHLSLKDFIHK